MKAMAYSPRAAYSLAIQWLYMSLITRWSTYFQQAATIGYEMKIRQKISLVRNILILFAHK